MTQSIRHTFYRVNFLLFALILHLFSTQVIAQKTKSDSLLIAISTSPEDTTRVNLLNDLYHEYQYAEPEKAYEYAKKALAYSQSSGFSRGEGSSLNNIGFYYFNKGKSSEALVYYLKANDIFTQIAYSKGKAIVFANIGNIFYNQGNYNKAIEYFTNSLFESQKTNDSSRVAVLLENIGRIYYVQGSYSKALDLFIKSLKIHEKMRDKKGMAYVYGNIGLIYDSQSNFEKSLEYYNRSLSKSQEIADKKGIAASLTNIGQLYLQMENYKGAIDNLLLALKVYTEIDDKDGISKCLQNIGDYYRVQNDYTKALEYFARADKLSKELQDKMAESTILGFIGDIYIAQNNYAKALESYHKSLDIAVALGIKDLMKQDYQAISTVNKEMGNVEEAYKYLKKYSEIKDSIYTEESISQIADMQTKYETEKREDEINLLKKDSELQTLKINKNKILMYSFVSVFFLLAIIIVFIFTNYRHRQRVKELNADIALRESEEKYRDLANLLPQIMFEVDNLSRLTFLNISGLKMTGYYVEDIMDGMDITELFSSDEREDILGNIKEMFSGKELKSSEYKVRRKDGTLFPALCYFNSYIGKDKNQGIRGIAVDITEHNQIERRILSKVIETEEKERKRIAKDLHDGLGPLLSSVKLYVNELQSADTDDKEKKEMLKYTNELIDDAVSSTRTIANNLMPGIITDYGLVKALQSFCNKLNIAKSINILFNAEDISLRFDSTIEITLYRVLMELINNSIKHASAKNIGITFKVENNFLNILFTDDGKGFDVSRTMNDPTGGMGLNNIINRVKSIQGTCEFISNVGAGTTVKIEINLQQT